MKTILSLLLAAAVTMSAAQTFGQGSLQFENLDFEAANIQQSQTPGQVSSLDALPGWSVYLGANQQTLVGYNSVALGSTWVTLQGTNAPFGIYNSIEGNFSLLLQGGGTAPCAAIAQTGLVPANAQSLNFQAQAGGGTLVVSVGGQIVPFFATAAGPNYSWYGADVSAFAGQTVELRFSALQGLNDWNLDTIRFSPVPIPEPGTLALFAIGALLLGWRFVRSRQ
jgi:hypothetical protein